VIGCSGDEAVHAFDTLLVFTFGSVLWQLPRTETERERLIRAAVADPQAAPRLLEQASSLARCDRREYFKYGLGLVLRGREARLNGARS
jgi:hypothetical protein